jgi:serine protease inhibitor
MSLTRSFMGTLLLTCAITSAARSLPASEPWVRNEAAATQFLTVARPSNDFGTKVFNQLLGPTAGANVVMSPYSLSSALDMLNLGADGATARLLRVRRGQSEESSNAIEAKAKVHRSLASASQTDLTLRLANSIWLKPNARPRPAFVAAARGMYDASVVNVDFSRPATVQQVNEWVKGNTQGVIAHIVDELDPQTEFLLVNTTYFKGKWAVPFDKAETKPMPFTRANGSKHDVPMMNVSATLRYAETPHWHALSLPYRGDRFEMLVLTAKDPAKSEEVRRELGEKGFLAVLRGLDFAEREARVRLPRFRAEYGADLTEALTQLGLGPAFGPKANYRQITRAPLRTTGVIHRAVVEVTEEGTEAAAATAVATTRSLETPEPVEFAADRPFAFGIVDSETGVVLFMGYIADPAP